MKKFLVFLMFFGAACNCWAPCVRTSTYDYADNKIKICASFDPRVSSSSVPDGSVAFDQFPNVSQCVRWSGTARWNPLGQRICSGFDPAYRNQYSGRIIPSVDVKGNCWKWSCMSPYLMAAGGICQSQEEKCKALGQVVDAAGTGCQPNWCSGWTGFNDAQHYEEKVGSCSQFRCKQGSGFRSAADRTCVPCEPVQGTEAGCYLNYGPTVGTDWIVYNCNSSQFVNKNGTRWECKTKSTIDDAQIKGCWKCIDRAAALACLAPGGAPCK